MSTAKPPRYHRSERDERIAFLEKEMRELFFLPFINDQIVENYLKYEAEWKRLTGWKMDTSPVFIDAKTRKPLTTFKTEDYVLHKTRRTK